eukprot:2814706-Prymnesium_polylepis.1
MGRIQPMVAVRDSRQRTYRAAPLRARPTAGGTLPRVRRRGRRRARSGSPDRPRSAPWPPRSPTRLAT